MSDIPKGWVSTELASVVALKTGPFGSSLHQSDYVTNGIPLVNPMHILNGRIRPSADVTVTLENVARLSEFRLKKGDLVLARRGEMGRCAVVKEKEAGWLCGTGSLIVRPELRLLAPDFLQGFLSSASSVKYLLEASVGSTMPNLNQQHLLGMRLRLPPRAEQTRIVAKLEELLSDLDAGVAELKAAQKKLAQYRQSLLKAAVEGALTAQWRAARSAPLPPGGRGAGGEGGSAAGRHPLPNPSPVKGEGLENETGAQLLARILTERRARWEAKQLAKFADQGKTPPKDWQKKYPEPVPPDTSDLPELPQGWVWASVEQLGDVQLGRQRSPDKLKGISPTRYIRAANITEAGINFSDVLEMDFSEQERATFALGTGDVLLTEASGSAEHVGRPAIWPSVDGLYCFQNTVLRFRPQGIGSEFAFYSFLAMQKLGVFSNLSGGVGINHLSAGKFSKLPVALPASKEQVQIVRELVARFAAVEEQEQAITHSLKQSTAQRQNLLRAAFAGELVPQDPSDEPASALLERIRAERAAQAAVKKPRGRKAKGAA